MKLFFGAISIFAAVALLAIPSWALMGTDDNVPGYDILLPFFLVSPPDEGNMDTVIEITETNIAAVDFHLNLFSGNGNHLADAVIQLEKGEVKWLSVKSFIDCYATASSKAELLWNLSGDEYYIGYMVFENRNGVDPKNHVTARAYVLDFTRGISAATNLPVREVDESLRIADNKIVNPTRHTEYFSPNALYRAQQYIEQQPVVADADYFRILPRYFFYDSDSYNHWFIWSSWFAWSGSRCSELVMLVYDNQENAVACSLTLCSGLNILDVSDFLPPVFSQYFPAGGWAEIRMPDYFGGDQFDGDREMLGYSFGFKSLSIRPCSDTNVNGRVDIGDAMFIAQHLVGNRDTICNGCIDAGSGVFFLTPMSRDANRDVGTTDILD